MSPAKWSGDLVVTASGVTRPIKWLGHRTRDCRNHLRPHEVMPVHISAQAFGPGRPTRDLFVSPGHAICVDGTVTATIGSRKLGRFRMISSCDASGLAPRLHSRSSERLQSSS